MDIDQESYLPWKNPFHDGTDTLFHDSFLGFGDLEYELVMYLQKHAGLIPPVFYEAIQFYHSELHDIGSRTLDRHIDGFSLGS